MAAIFQRIQGMREILSVLSQVKFDDITKAVGLINVIQDEHAPIRSRVLAVIDVADILCDYTETPSDDLLVGFVRNLANEEGTWRLVALVQDLLDGNAVPVGAIEGQGLEVGAIGPNGEKGAIPWPLVIQLAQIIVSVIQGLKK
jgi:hypothetical protein